MPRAWPARSSGPARSAKCGSARLARPAGLAAGHAEDSRRPPRFPIRSIGTLWLGGAACASVHRGRRRVRAFAAEFMAAGRGGGAARGPAPGGAPPVPRAVADAAAAVSAAARSSASTSPFNWRGFYDFGSGLFGDWGVHIMGPANWALQLSPQSLISVEAVKREGTSPFTYPHQELSEIRIRRTRQSAPCHRLLERQRAGRCLPAAGHDRGARRAKRTVPKSDPRDAAADVADAVRPPQTGASATLPTSSGYN